MRVEDERKGRNIEEKEKESKERRVEEKDNEDDKSESFGRK